ncbi:MAG: regulatory protein RecX [Thiomargarita sp.]|nr:regulatory protein RecX [Thiomargarita sp.]
MSNQNLRRQIRADAIKFLARRDYSILELREKLINRDFANSLVDEVLIDLMARGVLSDERFAESYIRMRSKKGFGPLHIRDSLRVRGIEDEILESILDVDNSIWVKNASNARIKRFGHELPKDERALFKQMRFLQQRGFTIYQIKRILSPDEDIYDFL